MILVLKAALIHTENRYCLWFIVGYSKVDMLELNIHNTERKNGFRLKTYYYVGGNYIMKATLGILIAVFLVGCEKKQGQIAKPAIEQNTASKPVTKPVTKTKKAQSSQIKVSGNLPQGNDRINDFIIYVSNDKLAKYSFSYTAKNDTENNVDNCPGLDSKYDKFAKEKWKEASTPLYLAKKKYGKYHSICIFGVNQKNIFLTPYKYSWTEDL